MEFKRGAIYLADFNPSKGTEPGKIRPCLVIQSDLLNEAGHPSTLVIPLTTQLIDDAMPLRLRIEARDQLRSDSDVMIDQARAIDNARMTGGPLTMLSDNEIVVVEEYLSLVLGLSD
jgi:mRNA interferase MazF